jgi:hypothetical protein|tara:strand:+ start:1554 stop:1733 length:180 start_codon:yes stop_codon:yes gene_type:complete
MKKEEADRLKAKSLEDTLSYVDTLNECEEVYENEEGEQFIVPFEIVRDFSRAEKLEPNK